MCSAGILARRVPSTGMLNITELTFQLMSDISCQGMIQLPWHSEDAILYISATMKPLMLKEHWEEQTRMALWALGWPEVLL